MGTFKAFQCRDGKILIEAFAAVFSENIATRCEDKRYAAGHRVRGDALEQVQNEQAAVLLEAKPCRHKKGADNHMPHLRPQLCLPVDPNSIPVLERDHRQRFHVKPAWSHVWHLLRITKDKVQSAMVSNQKWCRSTGVQDSMGECTEVPLGFDSCKFERCTGTQTTESHARRHGSLVRLHNCSERKVPSISCAVHQ